MGYKLKTTKDELYKKGFHYNKRMSDTNSNYYSIRFPVLKYNNSITTLECELSVELESGDVIINVFKYGTENIYPPYYNNEYGVYKILEPINKSINSYIKKLGIKRKDKRNE